MENYKEFIKRKNKQFENSREKRIVMKDIGRKGKFHFVREAWVFMPQTNMEPHAFTGVVPQSSSCACPASSSACSLT